MFDPVTAEIMRSAPALPGLNPAELPQLLTAQYAELVARRLRRVEGAEDAAVDGAVDGEWPLARIADAYEIVVSVRRDADYRRAAAFVAGTAHQILAQDLAQTDAAGSVAIMDRDRIHPAIAAAVLFLVAEQYADAHEAARSIRPEEGEQGLWINSPTICRRPSLNHWKVRLFRVISTACSLPARTLRTSRS